MQEDEEEHLDELKELFKAVTGEDLVEIEEDDVEDDEEDDVELETELELVDVDPAATEAPVDEEVEAEAEIEDEAPEAPEAIDVIKDKLDIQGEGDVVVVAEKGQLDNPDAPKVEG